MTLDYQSDFALESGDRSPERGFMADFHGLFKALLISVLLHFACLWPSAPAPVGQVGGVLQVALPPVSGAATAKHVTPVLRVDSPVAIAPAPSATRVPAGVEPRVVSRAALQGAPASLALPEQTSGIDAGGLRQYRVSLAARLASLSDWRAGMVIRTPGRIVVAVQLLAGSQMPIVMLVESDMEVSVAQAVVQAVRRGVAETTLPTTLVGQSLVMHVPFEFAP